MKDEVFRRLYLGGAKEEFAFKSKFRASIIKVLSGAAKIEVSPPPSPIDTSASSFDEFSD